MTGILRCASRWLCAVLILGAGPAFGQSSDGLVPPAVLSNFEPVQVRSEGQRADSHQFWWIQSRLRRAGNDFRLEREERLNVLSTRWRILEFDRSYDESAIFEAVLSAWEEDGYQERFRCSGSACGSSQDWANQVFGESILYGLDRRQHYSTGTVGDDIRVLYAVQRGTQVNYLYWLEAVRTRPEDRLANALIRGQAVSSDAFEPPVWLALLNKYPDWRLVLVGHDYDGTLDESMAQGQAAAEAVLERWSDAGVAPTRIRTRSVGYLAPEPGQGDRVSVILPPTLQQQTDLP